MAKVQYDSVWKLFGASVAVRDLQLDAADGEFLVLVGPSGCGKTTSLRMLGGLETPSYGRILIDDQDATLWPPGRRDVAMVFQSYALYPHMNVYRNLAFGPTVRHESQAGLRKRIEEVAEVLGIESLLDRRPSQLSGGQRQRVALGRALIRQPKLFLLDEPLSNLDAALRVQMRTELVRLHNKLDVTTVYVTHDQVEALTMGHRVAVFDRGALLQVGTPQRLYDAPANVFVASFIGSPRMNLFPGELAGAERARLTVTSLGSTFTIDGEHIASGSGEVTLGLRPHDLHLKAEAPARCTSVIAGLADVVEHTGTEIFAEIVTAEDVRLMARMHRSAQVDIGQRIEVVLDPGDFHVFSAETGEALLDRSGGMTPAGLSGVMEQTGTASSS
ncbi:MAG TPA: ABC transporter ATP-binding protein [Streptosporangiaceae bacterium]|nr:ABC transporter ATP-binding protein [Streptosporangiaceae bacterium]